MDTKLGSNPLDGLGAVEEMVGGSEHQDKRKGSKKQKVGQKKAQPTEKKERLGALLPVSIIKEAKAAVVSLAGPPGKLNVSKLLERAIVAELEKLREKYNGGKPFESSGSPRMGRPVEI